MLEEALKVWKKETRQRFLRSLARAGIRNKMNVARQEGQKPLYSSIVAGTRKRQGEIASAFVSFAKSGIYVEHGSGRGRKKGSAAATKARKPWILQALNPTVDQLGDILIEHMGAEAVENIKINIPGVITTKIKK